MTLKEWQEKIEKSIENSPTEVEKWVDEALRVFPDNIEFLQQKALLQEKNGLIAQAINTLIKILDIAPENSEAKTRKEYLETIQKFRNTDIYASTNLGHDPWLDE